MNVGVDTVVAGPLKGSDVATWTLFFNAISAKAIEVGRTANAANGSYWRWDETREMNRKGFFPYTPATNLLCGLREVKMIVSRKKGFRTFSPRHRRPA